MSEIYNQPSCILPKSFFEGRDVPVVHPDSLDWEQWWDEQEKRCVNGYSDGGFSLSGANYYHVNFKKINMLDSNDNPFFSIPYYSQDDNDFFDIVGECRRDGQGLMLITGRGFGKSYNASTIAEHGTIFRPAYETIVSASTMPFVNGLWSKIMMGLYSVHPEFRPSFLVENKDYLETGYKVTIDGRDEKEGYFSKLWKVAYDEKPGKTRGTRPNTHIFEEVGSWSGAAKLIKCYKATEASWWRGAKFTSFPLLIGTGGEMESGGSEDAKKMFNNPEAYNLRAFEWDGVKQGLFMPAYNKFGGFYEDSGISDKIGAKEFLDARRNKKKTDIEMYRQETMEFPFNADEAFAVSGTTTFDLPRLEQRFADIMKDDRLQIVRTGHLEYIRASGRIIGVEFTEHKEGIFEIVEEPEMLDGTAVRHLYVGGCDSFDASEEENTGDKSKGSLFIYKRFWKASKTGNCYVAKFTQRTKDATEFYENTVKLNMWYNAKMLYEYTKIGIGQHYIREKLHHMLYERPKLEETKVIKKTVSTNKYGLTMPDKVKIHMINRYAQWMNKNVDQMFFLSQLKDAIDFRFGSPKFDETMAAALCIIADDDMYDVEVRETKKNSRTFPKFVRDSKGNMQFR